MDQDSTDSEELLRRAVAGDEAALGALWERHRARLRLMVRLRLDRRLQGRLRDLLGRVPGFFDQG